MNVTNAIGGAACLALWGGAVGAAGAAGVNDDVSREGRTTGKALAGVGLGVAALGIGLTPGPFQPALAKARIYALCAAPLALGVAGGAWATTQLIGRD